MPKKYIGKSRADNLNWLLNVWLKDGPPVCFLQGFSGVGKSDLARDFRELAEKQQWSNGQRKWQQAVINEIADRPTPSVLESLMELSSILSQQDLPEMEKILFEQTNPNPAYALERVLQRPVLIIIDEAQRFFRDNSGAPLPEMDGILAYLRNRQDLAGRLLLLSDRVVEDARWSEWIPKRTLSKLEPEEAVEALDTKLAEAGVVADISPARKQEVVRDLDFNPRAIETLVGALRYESLDDIIESNPGLWAVRNREVSPDFLDALERDLLERTLRHLNEVYRRKLLRLSVHRRNFKRDALDRLCGSKAETNELRTALVSHYLLNFHAGAHSLNPIVREILLTRLRADPAEYRQAHSGAADYYLRHFKAKQIVGTASKLGESFAEARYHLVQAGRAAELGVIGQRFTEHLKREINSTSPVPTDAAELDERIAVLTVLLGSGGAKGLEYHLARCLQSRRKPGDIREAVIHAERTIGHDSPEQTWNLLANLKAEAEGPNAAIDVVRRGIQALNKPDLSAPLYQLGAEILAGANRTQEAIELIEQGIAIVPPKALFSLYQTLSEFECRAGRVSEAIAVQREGLQRISWQFNGHRLAEGALYLCAATDAADTLTEILSGTGSSALTGPQVAVGHVLQCQMREDWRGGAEVALAARRQAPRYFTLGSLEALCRLAVGDAEAAWQALNDYEYLTFGIGEPHVWLTVWIQLRRGAREDAAKALASYLGRPVDERKDIDESFLLRLWDQQEISPKSSRLCFHYPIIPAALTGLGKAMRRVPFGKPVLSLPEIGAQSAAPSPRSAGSSDEPEVYVSYAWGDDQSPEGMRREEVVNQMCAAVARTGRVVGRDKTVMKPGDSIEAFADKIAKAPRIVAVISAKSLHSKFCMVDEIYSAYQRSGFRRPEFQSKLVALVMDDAAALLRDDLALVKHWKTVHEQDREALRTVDPDHKAVERWGKVHKLGEMCDRLLDMLDAIKDIVMPRGYENIVRGNFAEVISRLPPKRA